LHASCRRRGGARSGRDGRRKRGSGAINTSRHLVAVAIRPGGCVQLVRGAHSHLWSVEAIVHGKRDRVAQDDSYHFVVPVLPLDHPDDRLTEGVLQCKEEKRPVIIETVVGPRARPLLAPPFAALCQRRAV
jgi:hypothetical protein